MNYPIEAILQSDYRKRKSTKFDDVAFRFALGEIHQPQLSPQT